MKKNTLLLTVSLIMLLSIVVLSEGLKVTVSTKTYSGQFAPKNALAIWVMDLETDQYLSTILLSTAAATYEGDELKNYTLYSAGENDYLPVDPPRTDHTKEVTGLWDCVTYYDQIVWDGEFIIWVEFSEESTFNPSGTYNGKTVFDTITIDRSAGFATVTAPDTEFFSGFTITYDPSISIKTPFTQKGVGSSLRYRYSPQGNTLLVTSLTNKKAPAFLRIFDLKGALINKLAFNAKHVTWNMQTAQGQTISKGTYIIDVQSTTGQRIGSACPFTFTR